MTRIRTILGFLLLAAVSLSAQVASDPIQDVEGVTFEQKLNAQVPMDLEFRDSEGRMVTLRDFVQDGKPVILSLVYALQSGYEWNGGCACGNSLPD